MKISVIIAAYNAEAYLKRGIESALAQTYQPYEIIVADDCSTDGTLGVARSFGGPVRVLPIGTNGGPAAARNAAAAIASGDWLAFLDADDWFFPEKLAAQQLRAEQNPNAVLIYTGARAWSRGDFGTLPFTPPEKVWPALRYRCPFQIASVMVRREAFEAVGGFDANRRFIGIEDWELWLRMRERFGSSAFQGIEEPLSAYRIADASLSTNVPAMLAASQALLDTHLLRGTNRASKFIWRRRILAFRYYDFSILLREQGNPIYMKFILSSLVSWPLPGATTPLLRYKVCLSMLYERWLRSFRVVQRS